MEVPSNPARRWRFTAGLRFRLTLTYLVFFTILLSFLGVFFHETLESLYDGQLHHILNEEWAAVRGYLRIEKGKANWFYDREDPEEALIVDRLKQIYLLSDLSGRIVEASPKHDKLLLESPAAMREMMRSREAVWKTKIMDGEKYLIRQGLIITEDQKPYFIAIGRSYEEGEGLIEQFTRRYSVLLPLIILTASFLGWFMAGRALRPIDDVARTAPRITGANL
ncbi:MAG TPA: hypothetical protein VER03_21960, partial [Bryobacteraceae bacterium]|nr:hypothetical protein [Bryobacteraceae bacterium]